jgi:hypothetical protein
MPPPPASVSLSRSYKSRNIKGGTVIAEDVLDLKTHLTRLLDPDSYRALIPACLHCGGSRIHALCFRERILRPADLEEQASRVWIRLFCCATKSCGAVFTVLPAFIARHLWRDWETVEESAAGRQRPPTTTRRRWLARLRSAASDLVQVFTSLAQGTLDKKLLEDLARASTRWEVVRVLSGALALPSGKRFSTVAGWIHRLLRGIRLM